VVLSQQIAQEEILKRAFENLVGALKPDTLLPSNVFSGTWNSYLFFPSDHMFFGPFVPAIKMLLQAENANAACQLNLSESPEIKFKTASAIYIDQATTGTDYVTKLRGHGPSDGWIYAMQLYGCASNVGRWCMYCERSNDIAVIALQNAEDHKDFEQPLTLLNTGPLESLCRTGKDGTFPFNKLTREFHDELTNHYGVIG
jgi:hypothetical protein